MIVKAWILVAVVSFCFVLGVLRTGWPGAPLAEIVLGFIGGVLTLIFGRIFTRGREGK